MADTDRPLAGLTVVVTRAKAQASVLTERLEALGADAVGVATIEIVSPADGGVALASAIERLSDYHQIVVASPNGARALAAAVASAHRAVTANPDTLPPVACVGPSTAAKLDNTPLTVNMVPDRALAEGLVDAMSPPAGDANRLLLVQAEVARDVLELGLAAKGWNVDRVTAYRTIDAVVGDDERAVAQSGDVITFTSSSTVERFVRLIGLDVIPAVVASIGPITSTTARELGVTVDLEAEPHTLDGLIDALVTWAASSSRAEPTA